MRKIETCVLESEYIHQIAEIRADDHSQFLKQLIACLPDLERGIVMLYLEGYKHQEIADIMGISYTHVTTKINRIKKSLRKKYLENEIG